MVGVEQGWESSRNQSMHKPKGAWGAGSASIVNAASAPPPPPRQAQPTKPSAPSSAGAGAEKGLASTAAGAQMPLDASKFSYEEAAKELNVTWQQTLAPLRPAPRNGPGVAQNAAGSTPPPQSGGVGMTAIRPHVYVPPATHATGKATAPRLNFESALRDAVHHGQTSGSH
ncbi:hypothetical protein FVE85_2627 [Porphyridium purpureum]|uniref:Uncharacterized protein n=1 Tax=Porphyridium purpureum TaxID=35688 RepID=A0A5J4YSR1_PORPP|nr:hypothetical protein FVE85_2627 [Porphyridium purpureum]|eukprot:POR9102..scf227_4